MYELIEFGTNTTFTTCTIISFITMVATIHIMVMEH